MLSTFKLINYLFEYILYAVLRNIPLIHFRQKLYVWRKLHSARGRPATIRRLEPGFSWTAGEKIHDHHYILQLTKEAVTG